MRLRGNHAAFPFSIFPLFVHPFIQAAVMENKALFEGKTVVDVGTGSGVLSVWSAQAGAAKVWAVEFTDMAKHAVSYCF